MTKYMIHLIEGDRLVTKRLSRGVPRVGEEIRLDEDKFYIVERVIWVYDESDTNGQRVNIAMRRD